MITEIFCGTKNGSTVALTTPWPSNIFHMLIKPNSGFLISEQWQILWNMVAQLLATSFSSFTGHGWFRRHRVKIDENSSQCRFCNSALEDPAHLWSSCRAFDGVRHAIRQECKKDNSIVSFSTPFVWSVTQLIRFFRDPKMAELLSGPGSQQKPL